MAKYRIYNKEIHPIGSSYINGDVFALSFPRKSEIGKRYIKHINKFLKEEKLKLVSTYFSGSINANAGLSQKRDLPKGYRTYVKKRNSKTKKCSLIERKFSNDTK